MKIKEKRDLRKKYVGGTSNQSEKRAKVYYLSGYVFSRMCVKSSIWCCKCATTSRVKNNVNH